MSNKDSVKIISIALAAVSLLITLFIWGQLSGFEKGYLYGVIADPPQTGFAAHGPNFFQTVNIWYFIIAAAFSVYISGSLMKPSTASNIICILSLAGAIYPFWGMYFYKKEVLDIEYVFPYDYWLGKSIYFDWFLLFAVIILLFIQCNLIITRKTDIETFDIN